MSSLSVDSLPPPAQRPHRSEQIQAVYGSYALLNDAPIHYFLSTISMGCMHSDVLTMRDIPGVEKWGLQALFQRELNDVWVGDIVHKYIRNPNRLKFFPPVTIALLPHESDSSLLREQYGQSFSFEPSEGNAPYTKAVMEGLTVEFLQQPWPSHTFPGFGQYARIQWDKNFFHALAIDGQHRISALKQAWENNHPQLNKVDVPAIFLVFDPSVINMQSLVKATREIFIDINRSSQRVDDSRLILLDDRRLQNVLTRRLIWDSYNEGAPSVVPNQPLSQSGTLVAAGIPQELVDMRAGRNAFDVNQFRPWQFTSAFIISRAIQHFVIENDIQKLEKLLDASSYRKESTEEYKKEFAHKREHYGKEGKKRKNAPDDLMLAFSPHVATALRDIFYSRYSSLMRAVFCGYEPYATQIQRYRDATNGDLGSYVREVLVSEGYSPQAESWHSVAAKQLHETDPQRFEQVRAIIKTLERPAGWQNDLSWYSVFQRAVLHQPLSLRASMEEGKGGGFDTRELFAEALLKELNGLHASKTFDKHNQLLLGVVTRRNAQGDVTIDSSDAASKRLGSLIRVLVTLKLAGPRLRRELLDKIGTGGARESAHPRFVNAAKQLVKAEISRLKTESSGDAGSVNLRAKAASRLTESLKAAIEFKDTPSSRPVAQSRAAKKKRGRRRS
jgi:hypothetical protein